MINLRSWIDPRIELVRADAIKSYLLKHGWDLDPRSDDQLLVFNGPAGDDGELIVLTLPASEKLRDFRPHVADRIGCLGIIENRYARDVLDDILKEGQALEAAAANGTPTKKTTRRPRK